MDIHCITEQRASLGESPVWSGGENCVYWIDIRGPALVRTDPASQETRTWNLPSAPGMIALRASGGLMVALEDGIYGFDPETGNLDLLSSFDEADPRNRFNDGKCDVRGRLWVGTMNKADSLQASGAFYRIDPDLTQTRVGGDYRIPNGLAWSPDNTVMYHTDSRSNMVHTFDFDPATGERSGQKDFLPYNREKTGSVDGAAMDVDGGYWAALYGGGKLIRVLADGTVDQEIPLPVTQPTMPAFGGADMKTLFITTASQRLSADQLASQPLAGGLLALSVDVPGHPVYPFGG